MRMQLVGVSNVVQGTDRETKDEYMYMFAHFLGRSLEVEGATVARVRVNLLKLVNLPAFTIGATYDVDISDKGYLRNIELLDLPKQAEEPKAEPPKAAEPKKEKATA